MVSKTIAWIVGLVGATCLAGAEPAAVTNVFQSPMLPRPETRLDKIVFSELAKLHIQPVLCSDAVFVRRAYLDVIGTLPKRRASSSKIPT